MQIIKIIICFILFRIFNSFVMFVIKKFFFSLKKSTNFFCVWQWEQWNQPKKLRNSVRIFQTSCLLVSVFAVCSTFKWIFSYCQHVKKRLIFNVSLFWFLIMFDIYFPSCKIRFTWNFIMKIKKNRFLYIWLWSNRIENNEIFPSTKYFVKKKLHIHILYYTYNFL